MRAALQFGKRFSRIDAIGFQIAIAGRRDKKSKAPQLVTLPLLKIATASYPGRHLPGSKRAVFARVLPISVPDQDLSFE